MRAYGGEKLDLEWINLISKAKKLGLSKEEIRQFLDNSSKK
ncbi:MULTISPECIES: anti-repressor SinI family protein [unclassified Alkalihalobacillus]|nr:anti-repressor SinI family protein [Alkalihalobacillus sp. CinArs1]